MRTGSPFAALGPRQGLADIARPFIQRTLNPRVSSYIAPYDATSTMPGPTTSSTAI